LTVPPELADRALSWNIAIKRKIIKALPPRLRGLVAAEEKAKSRVRAWVEHPFHVIKDRFHYRKVRYRGLKKNTAQLFSVFTLANLVTAKKPLLAAAPAH
jgi:IS5 family transposase